ncbi:lysophospholipase D GDPD1-like isoform X2 [Convolutriloba macropyga]|uniref:lysophospholipase D GDPD1-like isoform X2 n=1 Tax=Convolutriloba macropyga TaxID=536237 RepID=UPI003F51FE11
MMALSTVEVVLLSVVGTYCGLSLLLFFFPAILHKRKRLSPQLTGGPRGGVKRSMTTVAHRGGSHECIENTMSAFKHAVDTGIDVLEIDVQLTMDKRVVICHDNNLERLTGHRTLINETTYSDLPLIGSPQRGSFPREYKVEHWDRQIPLLEDLFTQFPHVPINLDVKEPDVNLRIQVESLIRQYNRESITVWGSWSDSVCKQLFKLNPNIPLLMSMRKIVIHAFLLWTGLLPFIPIKESFYEPPACRAMFANTPYATASLRQRMLNIFVDLLLGNWLLLFHYRRRGIVSWCWIVNDPSQFHYCFSKFDGVMTDRISLLVQYVQAEEAKAKRTSACASDHVTTSNANTHLLPNKHGSSDAATTYAVLNGSAATSSSPSANKNGGLSNGSGGIGGGNGNGKVKKCDKTGDIMSNNDLEAKGGSVAYKRSSSLCNGAAGNKADIYDLGEDANNNPINPEK